MFENYSIADLFANIYKKWLANLIAVIVIFCIVALPYTYRALNSKTEVKSTTNYSSYIIYKITSPLEEQQNFNKNMVGGYSDFYSKLISSNLNGAFLFNDLSEDDMKKVATELDVNETTLKNSNFDYWDKKIEVNSLVNNAGVTVKVLTSSKFVNEIIERKLDSIISQYKDVYQDVQVDKLDTVNSQELAAGASTTSGISKVSVLIRLAILGIGAVIITILANIALYIFNPTINRTGDYNKYGIDFIVSLNSNDNLKELLDYKNGSSSLVVLSSNAKVLDKFYKKYSDVLTKTTYLRNVNNIKEILEADAVLFVEEYGITRYKNFEENLQIVQNLNKKVLGVASFKL